MAQNDFALAIRQIAAERGIEPDEVVKAIESAVKYGFRHIYPGEALESLEVEVDIDKGSISAYADKKVVEEVTHPATQISLEDAQQLEPKLKLGDHVLVEITQSGDFGRVAAQAARQVISQMVREAEKDALLLQFKGKLGTIETGIVQRMTREGEVLFEINRATAKMMPEDQIPPEFYRSADRYKVLLKEIITDARGKILLVSRAANDFLRALFEMEVPEIASGTVEIMGIAREPGFRAKVAVRSNSEGVDAIGSCVGQRGARINAITNELRTPRGEEKIDIIPWSDDINQYLANAIRPAEAIEVRIINEEEKQALIIVSEDDQSLAIGREGQNARLAAKLTGWKLDIQGQETFKKNGERSRFEMTEEEIAEREAAMAAEREAKKAAAAEAAQAADEEALAEDQTAVESEKEEEKGEEKAEKATA